ncbi:MED14-domain-containing protein [Panus rudis PR-1116 ss-1]|nr:MED14-domain-containing protein [Panus rudis PR-1116 ss-1]
MDGYEQSGGPSTSDIQMNHIGLEINVLPNVNGAHEVSQDELERELPFVDDGQIPLGELVSRTVQTIYAELTELAETMPNMSDAARKRTLAEWVVKTKKQVVKLYAVAKWSRDAAVVQKAMNITAFLTDQNQQFEEAIRGLKYAKESLDPARLRNHDLLTSLDVLTTGAYRRLPAVIKEWFVPTPPMTDEEVKKTLANVEDVMRYRLRMIDIIPLEMANYRIADGRVFFTVPSLFNASLCVRGAKTEDGWFFVDVEFLFNVGGDTTIMQDFPRKPTGPLKRLIADEADARLAFFLPVKEQQPAPPGVQVPPPPKLPEGVIDTPLVRVFNFLQMMSLSYQLEILWYQAERLRSLGWADFLTAEMSNDRKTLTLTYWIRKPAASGSGRPSTPRRIGGTLTISITKAEPQPSNSPSPQMPLNYQPRRSATARVLAELQQRSKLGERNCPSDTPESLFFDVRWEPQPNALGITVPAEAVRISPEELKVDPNDLDVVAMLQKVITCHARAILTVFQYAMQNGPTRNVFAHPDAIKLVVEDNSVHLRVHLCADEIVIVTIDSRTGRLNMRDTGDLAASSRAPRFMAISEILNNNPLLLPETLARLRITTITDLAVQKAEYLGLQCYRTRNFPPAELQKLGPTARGRLYIQLSMFPKHYLVLVITDEEFRFALISMKQLDDKYNSLELVDIGWLDVKRIHESDATLPADSKTKGPARLPRTAPAPEPGSPASFRLDSRVLRELYAYCCARVAYTKVEAQFKTRKIPYTYVTLPSGRALSATLHGLQSSLTHSIPLFCVQSSDILSGAPAKEAAMSNIRVIPLHWWADRQVQVVTCVKLKYVQQPVGKRASSSSSIIRPSKRIIYDSSQAMVSFLSEDVETCVEEFLEEWAKVSKMVVIAREVAQMATDKRWAGVRLLSFDLQTVELAYAPDYSVSITCTDQLSLTGGTYQLRFSRPREQSEDATVKRPNPHAEVEPFMRNILRHGRLGPSLRQLVELLQNSLPVVLQLEAIRSAAEQTGDSVDTFSKSAGWFRVLYSDLRHALDFRLMKGARILVHDASHSIFQGGDEGRRSSADSFFELLSVLQPIPEFSKTVDEVVRHVKSHHPRNLVCAVEIGIICDRVTVMTVGRLLHERILSRVPRST